MSVPVVSSADGLPIGVQVVGRAVERGRGTRRRARHRGSPRGVGRTPTSHNLSQPVATPQRHATRPTLPDPRDPVLPASVSSSASIVSLMTIAGVGLYTVREVRHAARRADRHQRPQPEDSLQLLRIQNNLSTVATAMRDMADRIENYPLDRLEAGLRPAARGPGAGHHAGAARWRRLDGPPRSRSGWSRRSTATGRSWTTCSARPARATRTARIAKLRGPRQRAAPRAGRPGVAVPRAQQPRPGGSRRQATARSTSASSARSACW